MASQYVDIPVTSGGGGTPSGPAGGDLSGTYPNPTVNATSANTPSTIVKRDSNGNFFGDGLLASSSKNANYTLTGADVVILADTSGGAFNITFPSPSTMSGKIFRIVDSTGSFGTNNLTMVRAGSEMIQGLASSLILSANWGEYTFFTDGTNWFKLGGNSNTAIKSFSSSGTWVAPAGVTRVIGIGRGGSGGGGAGASGSGGSTTSGGGGGAGGASGGSAISNTASATVVPGTSYSVTVGAAGSGSTGGAPTAANSAGSVGALGGSGGSGGVTSLGSVLTFNGGVGGTRGSVSATYTVGGTAVTGAPTSFGGVAGGSSSGGAAATASASAAGTGASISVYGPIALSTSIAVGASGGTNGGGGGGLPSLISGGDIGATFGTPPVAAAGGASGSNGNAGTGGTPGTNGTGGYGGPGGGGGGLLATTGSQGGAGGNGAAGNAGQLILQWNE